jgi:zinc protease
LVVVGDIDLNVMETKIKSRFADWKGVGPAGVPMNRGKVDPNRPLAVGTFNDPTIANQIMLSITRPFVREDDSVAKAKVDLNKAIASGIMGKRFSKLAQATDAKLLGGSVAMDDQFNVTSSSTLTVSPKEGDWKIALTTGEQELRRALQYGFTQAEVDEQLANFDTVFDNAAKQASTRRSQGLADSIVGSLGKKAIITSPQQDLALYQSVRSSLTLEAANNAMRSAFGQMPNVLHITTKSPISDPQATIMAALQESNKVAVAAPEQVTNKAFAYEDFGKPGKVVADKMIADLGIRTIRFANNVRLNIKKTDFEQGSVRFSLRFGNGLLETPKDKGSLSIFMANMLAIGGLKEHSYEELQRIMAGKQVSLGLTASDDNFGTSGATTSKDIALQMKILAAYMTAGGYRAEADSIWKNNVDVFASQLDALPQTVAGTQVPRILASGDKRFGLGGKEELAARNIAEAKAILEPIAKDAPIDIAIVGDVDEAAIIKAVADSFGALPKRQLNRPVPAQARMASFPKDRQTMTLYHKGKADQGFLQGYWPTTDNKDQKSDISRTIASAVMRLLLLDEVREKLGASYSPGGGSFASDDFTGYGYMSASVIAAPDKMDIISASIKKVAKQMRDGPVADDVLLRARKPIMEQLDKDERENGSWLALANVAQSEPVKLDRRRNRRAILAGITPADIQKIAQQYMRDAEMLEIRIVASNQPSADAIMAKGPDTK